METLQEKIAGSFASAMSNLEVSHVELEVGIAYKCQIGSLETA